MLCAFITWTLFTNIISINSQIDGVVNLTNLFLTEDFSKERNLRGLTLSEFLLSTAQATQTWRLALVCRVRLVVPFNRRTMRCQHNLARPLKWWALFVPNRCVSNYALLMNCVEGAISIYSLHTSTQYWFSAWPCWRTCLLNTNECTIATINIAFHLWKFILNNI